MRAPTIILMYDSWDSTLGLIGQMIDREPNIWLIDNHSPEDRTEEARARFPQLRVIRTASNGGWAAAYNKALALASAEGHDAAFLLNSDALPEPGTIDHAFAILKGVGVAGVGSVIVSMNGRHVEYDGQHHRGTARPEASAIDPAIRPTPTLHGAAMAVSLAAFRAIGPFHEEYFLYHEETDWCARARDLGYSLLVDGSSKVRHMDGGSNVSANSTYYRVRNRFIAVRRSIRLSGKPETLAQVLADHVAWAFQENGAAKRAAMQGVVDGIRGLAGPRRHVQEGRIVLLFALLALGSLAYRAMRKLGRKMRLRAAA